MKFDARWANLILQNHRCRNLISIVKQQTIPQTIISCVIGACCLWVRCSFETHRGCRIETDALTAVAADYEKCALHQQATSTRCILFTAAATWDPWSWHSRQNIVHLITRGHKATLAVFTVYLVVHKPTLLGVAVLVVIAYCWLGSIRHHSSLSRDLHAPSSRGVSFERWQEVIESANNFQSAQSKPLTCLNTYYYHDVRDLPRLEEAFYKPQVST